MLRPLIIIYKILRFVFFIISKGSFRPSIGHVINKTRASCLIIGNGPSIAVGMQEIIDNFIRSEIFVVNNFVESEWYYKIKPAFYVFADPMYWMKDSQASKKDQTILLKIKQITDWELTILIPFSAVSAFKSVFDECPQIKLQYFNDIILDTETTLDYLLYKKSLACPAIQNVMVQAVYLALNIGYTEINLVGADHSWTKEIRVNKENTVCLIDNHFYDQDQEKNLQPWTPPDAPAYKMHEILIILARAFRGYHVLNSYASYLGSTVYNYTQGSFVDAFEKKSLHKS